MQEFYCESKFPAASLPHILGLTASPVTRDDISSLEKIEANLHAVCKSPTKHREELLSYSPRPALIAIPFTPKRPLSRDEYTESMIRLFRARNDLDIMEDPYIVALLNEKTDSSVRKLNEALAKKRTYIQDSMRSLCRRSLEIAKDLGSWAADWYMYEAIRRFLAGVKGQGALSQSFRDAEMVCLANVFAKAEIPRPPPFEPSTLSDKIVRVIRVLLECDDDVRGIIL